MRYLLVLLLAGCASSPAAPRWNTCVDTKAHIGYRLKNHNTGQIGTVREIYGISPTCTHPEYPMLASVEYE